MSPKAASLLVLALAAACGDEGTREPTLTHVTGREAYATVRERIATPVAPTSAAELAARAAVLRPFLAAASRMSIVRTPPAAALVALQARVDVRVEHLRLDGFEGMHLPATLYLPVTASIRRPVPAMVVNVGHDARGQDAPYVRSLAWSLARGGVAALTIDWLGMGTRFQDDQRHVPVGLRSIVAGLLPEEPLLGEPLSAWDYLVARPDIDPARVGMVGQSGGGMTTMHLAAIEPRIALAVVVDIVVTNDFIVDPVRIGWGDPDSIPPGELGETSHGEILGTIAPRPLLVLTGDEDFGIAPTSVAAEAVRLTRAWYALAGGTVEHEGFPTAHEFSTAKIERTLEFVGQHFLGAPLALAPEVPSETAPQAGPLPGDPVWLELVTRRWATAPELRETALEARTWVADARLAIDDMLGPATPTPTAEIDTAPTVILWLADDPRDEDASALLGTGVSVVHATPFGLDAVGREEIPRRFLGQNALGLGTSVLRLGLDDLQGFVRALRAGGARTIVAACDGEQAALLCAALGATDDAPDGLALAGLPTSFPARFPLDASEPTLGYLTLGLGAATSPELLATAAAPRPLALTGSPPWTFLPSTYALLGGDVRLDAPSLPAATAHVLSVLAAEGAR